MTSTSPLLASDSNLRSNPAAAFENRAVPTPDGSTSFLPPIWDSVLNRVVRPTSAGPLSTSPELRREFLAGAALLGLELVDLDDEDAVAACRARGMEPLQPQQLLIADAINAGLKRNVLEIPRRASKTTSILAVLLGRCVSRPGYKVTFSAQTGVAGRDALEEWIKSRLDPDGSVHNENARAQFLGLDRTPKRVQRQVALFGDELTPDELKPAGNPMRSYRTGNSSPGIRFWNGSTFDVLKPEGDAYRGRAADVSWLDEAQEINPDEGANIIAGILPLQDTRPGAQIIISGTAGEEKSGPFWDYLARMRGGDQALGGLDYYVDPDTPWEDIEDEDRAMELLQQVHPGIGTLTTLETMRENYRDIPRPEWAREYLSLWPETSKGQPAIDAELWARGRLTRWPSEPPEIAYGYEVGLHGSAALVAAWRSPSGIAYIDVAEHRLGERWIPEAIVTRQQHWRRTTFAYFPIGANSVTALEVDNYATARRTRVRQQPLRMGDIYQACERLMRDIKRGTIRHAGHPSLERAVKVAVKKEPRDSNGKWVWGADEDVSVLFAASIALLNWDRNFERQAARRNARRAQ